MKIHEQDMSSPLFKNVEDLKPVIRSYFRLCSLDNVFELLTHSEISSINKINDDT